MNIVKLSFLTVMQMETFHAQLNVRLYKSSAGPGGGCQMNGAHYTTRAVCHDRRALCVTAGIGKVISACPGQMMATTNYSRHILYMQFQSLNTIINVRDAFIIGLLIIVFHLIKGKILAKN